MPEVFVNYRTGDGDKTAVLVERALSSRFGEERIFLASRSIEPGQHFPEELLRSVRRCSVLLAIIGPGWATSPALNDAADWVRREIAEANECGIRVVPVLDGRKTDRLSAADLPSELAWLAEVQSLPLDTKDAEASLTRIGDWIARLVPELKEADRTPPPALRPAKGPAGSSVDNSAGDLSGMSVQGRDITGDMGTVIKDVQGQVHTGKGDQHNNHYNNSRHYSGNGVTHIEGGNQGGVHQRFGENRQGEDDDR